MDGSPAPEETLVCRGMLWRETKLIVHQHSSAERKKQRPNTH
jgi:hypothetical protein